MKFPLIMATISVMSIVASPSIANAKIHKKIRHSHSTPIVRDVTPLYAKSTIDLSARRHRSYRGGGLICGATQMAHYGIRDQRYRLARNWASFPHTNAHPGAVVVQSRAGLDSAGHQGGHVSRIVSVTGSCRAVVTDEKGTYERDICSRLIAYVDPNGNTARASAGIDYGEVRTRYEMAARSHVRHRHYARYRYVRYASYNA